MASASASGTRSAPVIIGKTRRVKKNVVSGRSPRSLRAGVVSGKGSRDPDMLRKGGASSRRGAARAGASVSEPTATVEQELVCGYTIPDGMPDIKDQLVEEVMDMGSTANFPIPGEALIRLTRGVLALNNGLDDEGECLDSEFKFIAPVVGPLDKTTFLKALNSFKLRDGFPEFNGRCVRYTQMELRA